MIADLINVKAPKLDNWGLEDTLPDLPKTFKLEGSKTGRFTWIPSKPNLALIEWDTLILHDPNMTHTVYAESLSTRIDPDIPLPIYKEVQAWQQEQSLEPEILREMFYQNMNTPFWQHRKTIGQYVSAVSVRLQRLRQYLSSRLSTLSKRWK